MALARIDQSELLAALYQLARDAPFQRFLDRFRRRVGARSSAIVQRSRDGAWIAWDSAAAPIDHSTLTAIRLGRVYTFEELGIPSEIDGRAIRSRSQGADHWLIACDSVDGFTAADSALMADLAPHIAIAGDNWTTLRAAERECAAAELALSRAGVAWSILDASPAPSPRDRAHLRSRIADGMPLAATESAIAIPFDGETLLLSRTTPAPIDRPVAFAAAYGTSLSEARLAIAIAEGLSIAESAVAIGVSVETARFYSKRLYAATGAKGQADLVRLVWTGTAGLA